MQLRPVHISYRMAILLVALFAEICPAQTSTAAARGTLNDNGKPLAGAQVVLTSLDSGKPYKATADQNGAFEINDAAPGSNYKVEVFNAAGQMVFSRSNIALNPESNSPAVLTIDTSDPSKTNLGTGSGGHLTSEQIAALRTHLAKAQTQNNLITQAINAMKARRWQEAVAPLQQLIADDPDHYEFQQSLGEVQFNLGQYDAAVLSFEKGIHLANNMAVDPDNPSTDPVKKKARIVSMLINEGNSFVKLRKSKEAIDAFSRATKADSTSEVAYFNLCAMLYNFNQGEAALPACDKAISLEPKHADAYFLKGSLLMEKSERDSAGNIKPFPGTAEALRKYLQLQPDGQHAAQVKNMLVQIGAKAAPANTETKKKLR